ncbi:hypothetical protein A3J56_00745 [Candidatus Giovannonibacteria bacterium RIFCSPHIGHO2_02_FULL_46_20]|uniref:UDP-N-acetylmuramyl-tripeptide synthetase n=1 Tax=Candidatus Giovannonibacteria bacterium RIFCSPHIGHO2_02_FULL_46_20 TaxID=1798338 RepID=A0A1F5WFU6_9BACT|nr:MAG: hypothetical protein A3J56_00745 [Candidatus Giovannonibacteria bacterium RIFCSPHIGHO2_02_FULL_46_20]
MIEKLRSFGRKIIPKPLFRAGQPVYHWLLAYAAALWYRFPSRKLTVIGVTGTNGKSTVVELLHAILTEAGESVASMSSIRFKINNKEETNELKMTMPGRFQMQKFLNDAMAAGCKYVVLEVTSEGIKQFRNKGIKFFLAVLTNVTPEHIESHGSFEEYRAAKAKLFYNTPNHIVNGEDANIDYFVKIPAKNRIVYTKKDFPAGWHSTLLGDFNKENIVAAYHASRFLGINPEKIKLAIEKFEGTPGRLEFIRREPFAVVVDYAHTPDALRKIYQTLRNYQLPTTQASLSEAGRANYKLICVLGAAGGGRDKWKRPKMGKIAAEFCDEIILTNEDPYDENPLTILKDVESGFSQIQNSQHKILNKYEARRVNYKLIVDRREAIRAAISQAQPSDVVVITGKGCEPWLMGPNGTKIPWDDRKTARDILRQAF